MRIAIIPARGGSKRVPGKNIRLMNGKPLIAWTIEACLAAGLFSHIVVSTDCEKIACAARKYGAEVPFMRPAELADDFTATRPVVEHALAWVKEHWGIPEYYCQLYANPFVTSDNIMKGLDLLRQSDADTVLAVAEFPYPILRAFKLDQRGAIAYAFPEYAPCRSQDLPHFYHDAAQFYWHRGEEPGKKDARKALPVILHRRFVVDIDTEEDWVVAERLHAVFLSEGAKS